MRTIAIVFAVLVLLTVAAVAQPAKQQLPSDEEVISLTGSRLAKVFAKFGEPQDIFPTELASDNPGVCLDYGSFGFTVRDGNVRTCLFWSNWTGAVCGVKLGSSADDVVKILGAPIDPEINGPENLFWDYKENCEIMTLSVRIKDHKCTRIVVQVP